MNTPITPESQQTPIHPPVVTIAAGMLLEAVRNPRAALEDLRAPADKHSGVRRFASTILPQFPSI